MHKTSRMSKWLWVLLVMTAVVTAGCLGPQHKPGEVFPCVAEGKLDKTIADEASLEEFSCVFKKWEGADTLHFKVALKNVSSEPQRYKVNISWTTAKPLAA